MYLTAFIHRKELFRIVERWFCGRPEPSDATQLTRIFICDGYVLGETLERVIRNIAGKIHPGELRKVGIRSKGELRDMLRHVGGQTTPRAEYLLKRYGKNPEYFYYHTPVNGAVYIDGTGLLVASYRIKRPKRIAEKANRRIAQWIFHTVQNKALAMASLRAENAGIPLDRLFTPREEMDREFIEAEASIADSFREGTIQFDRSSITIDDVGGMKILGTERQLAEVEEELRSDALIDVGERESFHGSYEASSLILDVEWNDGELCKKFLESKRWKRYAHRGITEAELKEGIEPLIENADKRIKIELILSTPEAMIESELGNSIHEERIIQQRDAKPYKGYIPTNIEFLLEYLFAVGFSPLTEITDIPIKLWGRYLPDTLGILIRELFHMPEYDLFY